MTLVDAAELRVLKAGRPICHVASLRVEAGERVGVSGQNGCGKSTLLRVLAALEPHFEGHCEVSVPVLERTYVHQAPYLFRGTVVSNVEYGAKAHGASATESRASAMHWLQCLGIAHLAERSARRLSGGERRRVAIARALSARPRLLLLDEPLAEIDARGAVEVCEALVQLTDTTIVIASPVPLPPGLATREVVVLAPTPRG